MNKCKFTIVTICYNAEQQIMNTVQSVLSQSFEDYEYIIKDGNSTDGTMDLLRDMVDGNSRITLIQEKDRGIFDAMNVAVASAKGEYVIFLNAGDRFMDNTVLQKTYDHITAENADIFYGNVVEIEDEKRNLSHLRVYTEKNSKMWYYSLGACLCHQTMFCKRELFENRLFDLNYKVCADREWQMYHIRNGASAKPLGFTVAEVLTEGFSTAHVADLERETKQCIKNYCGLFFYGYEMLMLLKKNNIVCRIIQGLEKKVSCK